MMNQHWRIDLTLYYDGYRRLNIAATVEATSRAEAMETAVNDSLSKKYGGALAVITERFLIGGEWIPAAFEFNDGDDDNSHDWRAYQLDDTMTEADLHEAVRPLAECEFMRLIGAMPLPLTFEETS